MQLLLFFFLYFNLYFGFIIKIMNDINRRRRNGYQFLLVAVIFVLLFAIDENNIYICPARVKMYATDCNERKNISTIYKNKSLLRINFRGRLLFFV